MKDMRLYLAHILECVERIERYTETGGRDHFLSDSMVQDAVIRNLEVMGEAAKRIDDGFRNAHPKIPWRGMTALRNVLIHDYEDVDLDEVWHVVDRELRPLRDALMSALPPLDRLESELAGDTSEDEPS